MVAFDRFGPRLRQHLEQAAQVPRAAIGRDPRVDAAAVGDEADPIAGRLRDVGQRQRGVDGAHRAWCDRRRARAAGGCRRA